MSRFQRAVPVLQVGDVERSMGWYVDTFGFHPDPFPEETLHSGDGWAVYLRTSGEDLLELATAIGRVTPLVRGPERMFYGLVEFEVIDPDGYRICVSGSLPESVNVPRAREREDTGR
jgi:hypothetical protein